MNHTPEPWVFWDATDARPHRIFLGKRLGCIEVRHSGYVDDDGSKAAEMKANARRIVACVNVCQRLSTEALENYYRDLTQPLPVTTPFNTVTS